MELKGLMVKDLQKDTLLYAGSVNVRITDWFFFKDKPQLKYIGFTNTVINTKRVDSVWNYQFIVNYFSSNDTSTKKGGIQFDIREVELENIHYNKTDEWVGKNVNISVKKLQLSADEINFAHKKIILHSLDIDEPIYTEHFYDGKRDSSVI